MREQSFNGNRPDVLYRFVPRYRHVIHLSRAIPRITECSSVSDEINTKDFVRKKEERLSKELRRLVQEEESLFVTMAAHEHHRAVAVVVFALLPLIGECFKIIIISKGELQPPDTCTFPRSFCAFATATKVTAVFRTGTRSLSRWLTNAQCRGIPAEIYQAILNVGIR